ncbi:hypothetical protein COB55_00320 [Candidatus Wolfebacteria bacterium]|nr:MAG: hypothetical protein COB55_00320 [Candidatus Wolfebacteria bacterium]
MYHSFDKKIIPDFSDTSVESLYDNGYVFTREAVGSLDQIRSVRIDVSQFELSSENKRILSKTENIHFVSVCPLPLKLPGAQRASGSSGDHESQSGSNDLASRSYSWEIGKLAKDFYESRNATFSANKIKELMTSTLNNFNTLFSYTEKDSVTPLGYAIGLHTANIVHYSYPFYDIEHNPKDTGLAMMIYAILYAKKEGKKYIYLGSLSRYKLQFKGLEWFDGKDWKSSIDDAKNLLKANE